MPARCFVDTETIETSEAQSLSGPKYQIDVKLDGTATAASPASPTPTTEVELGYGIGVKISPDANNRLVKTANGLKSVQVNGVVQGIANNPFIGIPATATTGAASQVDTADHVLANPLGVPAIAMISGEIAWFYRVTPLDGNTGTSQGLAGNWFAFNAQMVARIFAADVAGSTVADKSYWQDISGVVEADTGQDKGEHQEFSAVSVIPAGGSLHLRADAAYVATALTNQRRNVSFDVSQSNPARGFRLENIDVVWVPS